jgi:hypothetical protein
MPAAKDRDLRIQFLKCLSKIKGWHYHDRLEVEKKQEIREFISVYVFKNIYGEILQEKISYNRLSFLITHPAFKPFIKAILTLPELSDNEKEFNERYRRLELND